MTCLLERWRRQRCPRVGLDHPVFQWFACSECVQKWILWSVKHLDLGGGGVVPVPPRSLMKWQWQKSFDSQQEKTFQENHLLKLVCGSVYFTCDYATLNVCSQALCTDTWHAHTDPMAPREVLFLFGSWTQRDSHVSCVCTASLLPPRLNDRVHSWEMYVKKEMHSMGRLKMISYKTWRALDCFFFFKFEQLHVISRLNLTTICCILRCLGFIPPSPNTPSHNVSVAYPRSESDLSRGLTSSSLPMLHTSTNFYDHHQL